MRVLTTLLTSCAAGAAITAGALAMPATATADTAHQHDMYLMCTALAANPTLAGVTDVIGSWLTQQGTSEASIALGAQTLMDATATVCPEYRGIVTTWANLHAPSPSSSAVV